MGEYVTGSGLEIPGLEAIMEYGDSSVLDSEGRIKGAMRINDRSVLEQVRVDHITGLHDDPDGRDSRQSRSDQHGEDAGIMLYGGRTIGLTGSVRAGSIPAVRDVWRRFRGQFGIIERDLLIHGLSEVQIAKNMVLNPNLSVAGTYWADDATVGTIVAVAGGVSNGNQNVGSAAVNSAGSSGELHAYPDMTNASVQAVSTYADKDIWLTARVSSAGSDVLGNIYLGLGQWTSTLAFTAPSIAIYARETSPTSSAWYTLSIRIPASSVEIDTAYVAPYLIGDWTLSGSYQLSFTDVGMVFLDQSDPTPVAYFDGDVHGFEWDDGSYQSTSRGPLYVVNQIPDVDLDSNVGWATDNTAGVIVSNGPISAKRNLSTASGYSIYYDASSSASGQKVSTYANVVTPMLVTGGRTYKLYGNVAIIRSQNFKFDAVIEWLDEIGLVISSSTTTLDTVDGTTYSFSITDTAPANATQCHVKFGWIASLTTASNQILRFSIGDLCLVDVTSYDPGSFSGRGDASLESLAGGNARRRIPRPFLIKGVRKTSDMKAPEQQDGPNAWRDFTMSLRASDPRIYVLDERREPLTLSGSPQFVAVGGEVFTLDTTNVPVPTGFTSEGSTNTTGYGWSTRNTAPGRTSETNHPLGGVGHKDWQTPVGSGANSDLNTPLTAGNDMLTRYYRSAEGYTYTKPRVVFGCHPAGRIRGTTGDGEGWAWNHQSGASAAYYYNTAAILLKRVSSTAWLELRWNAMTHAFAQSSPSFGLSSNAPYALELWCSHNESGTLTTTRLAHADYASVDSSVTRNVPFDPVTQPMWLVAWLDSSEVVHWELWKSYPSLTNTTDMVESGSFTLPSATATVVGSGVAGSTGWSLKTAGVDTSWAGGGLWQNTASNPPFMHYFEASKYDSPAQSVEVPVIGSPDVDTPPVIVLTGRVVNPVISMTVPQEDGTTEIVSARFIGTFDEGNPVTIDLNEGTIKDSNGSNAYSTIQPGGGFLNFRPGVNTISVQAENWDTSAAEHLVVRWRDALS